LVICLGSSRPAPGFVRRGHFAVWSFDYDGERRDADDVNTPIMLRIPAGLPFFYTTPAVTLSLSIHREIVGGEIGKSPAFRFWIIADRTFEKRFDIAVLAGPFDNADMALAAAKTGFDVGSGPDADREELVALLRTVPGIKFLG
jgi:hypothetical protein